MPKRYHRLWLRFLRVQFVGLVVALSSVPALGQEHQELALQILDAQGVAEATARKIQRSAEALLKKLSGLPVSEGPPFKPGPRRSCADLACQRTVVPSVGPTALLSLSSTKGAIAFEVSFWLDGERLGVKSGAVDADAPDNGLTPALAAVLPAWAKRGWGALRLEAPPGAVVKLDGRPMKLNNGQLLSLPAGAHQLDVVYAEGGAVLQRVEVAEGVRIRVDLTLVPMVVAAPVEGTGVLRAVSFGLWTAGALAIAASLVAGAISRQTGVGQNPCVGDSRTCATFGVASERHRQAQAYASTGNILLGTGLSLGAAGAGVFVFDLVTR